MILFLDTISPSPKFSVIKNNKIIHSIHIIKEKNNKISDTIIPSFAKVLKKIKIDKKFTKLLVCTGPGSYTSLRIGIAFMYGLSLSKNIPLIGMPCLKLFEMSMKDIHKKNTSLILVCSPYKQYFYCLYSKNKKNFPIKKIYPDSDLIKLKKDYEYSFSNHKVPSKIQNKLSLKKHKILNLSKIISTNYKTIQSMATDKLIEPIYISDNKILN